MLDTKSMMNGKKEKTQGIMEKLLNDLALVKRVTNEIVVNMKYVNLLVLYITYCPQKC